jgi:hypothetical protein
MESLLCDLSWLHLGVAGLASDIAGAVVLGLSFSTKSPEQIREEVPETVGTTVGYAYFPQGLADSLIRQRAEARLGLALLVLGFLMQGAVYFTGSSDPLTSSTEILLAAGIALGVWALAYLAMRSYVPWDERQTRSRMDSTT